MTQLLCVCLLSALVGCLTSADIDIEGRIDNVFGDIQKLEDELKGVEKEPLASRAQRRKDLRKYDNKVFKALPSEIEKLKQVFHSEESSADKATNNEAGKASNGELPRPPVPRKSAGAAAAHKARVAHIAAHGKPKSWSPKQCGQQVRASELGLKRGRRAAQVFKTASLLQVSEDPEAAHPGVGAVQTPADNGRDVVGNVAGVDPFLTVYKDGYFSVACLMDSSWKVGDKYGDNKDNYKWGKTTNVSVAMYDELVLEMEQKKMSPKVCYEFCRTVPGMGFFGITAGKTCYCTPYFVRVAGNEDDKCSMMCPGSQSEVCGGQSKSSIFELHTCGDREAQLAKKATEAGDALTGFYAAVLFANELSQAMQASGAKLKEVAGLGGDSGAADLGMLASQYAGDVTKSISGDCIDHYNTMLTAYEESENTVLLDMKQAVNLGKADEALEIMAAKNKPVNECTKAVVDANKLGFPLYEDIIEAASESDMQEKEEAYGKTLAQYFPLMYVLKNKEKPMQSTCKGTGIAKPVVGTMAECAQSCDELVFPEKCIAFQYFDVGSTTSDDLQPVCFLFKDVKSSILYDCDFINSANEDLKEDFLQLHSSSLRASRRAAGPEEIASQHCATVHAIVAYTGMTCETIFGEGTSVTGTCPETCAKSSAAKWTAQCMVKLSEIVTGMPNLESETKKRCFGGGKAEESSSPTIPSPHLLPFDSNGVVLSGDVEVLGRSVLEPVIWTGDDN